MKWPARDTSAWQRKFAWFPVRIGLQWVWWEPFEERLNGWGTDVRLPV